MSKERAGEEIGTTRRTVSATRTRMWTSLSSCKNRFLEIDYGVAVSKFEAAELPCSREDRACLGRKSSLSRRGPSRKFSYLIRGGGGRGEEALSRSLVQQLQDDKSPVGKARDGTAGTSSSVRRALYSYDCRKATFLADTTFNSANLPLNLPPTLPSLLSLALLLSISLSPDLGGRLLRLFQPYLSFLRPETVSRVYVTCIRVHARM